MQLKVGEIALRHNGVSPGRHRKTRVYVWPKGETVMDNLMNRRSRPINEFRSAAYRALSCMGVDLTRVDLKWSQKAGCSCGCSPGFIVDGYDPVIDGKDMHVDVEMS